MDETQHAVLMLSGDATLLALHYRAHIAKSRGADHVWWGDRL